MPIPTPVNVSARQWSLTINGVDCKPLLHVCDFGEDAWSETGLILRQGTITLRADRGAQNLDNRTVSGRSQWARGRVITIDIPDSTGTPTRPTRGHLRILSSTYESRTNTLTLEVGDSLVLYNVETPASDRAGVILGTMTDRTDIINNLLAEATNGAETLTLFDSITDWPINYPLPREGGTAIQQAGKVAADANGFLWVDGLGRIRFRSNSLRRERKFYRVVEQDVPRFSRDTGIEAPAQEVLVSTTAYNVTPNNDNFYKYTDNYPNGWTVSQRQTFRAFQTRIEQFEQHLPLNQTQKLSAPEVTNIFQAVRTRTESSYEAIAPATDGANPENQQRLIYQKHEEWGQIGVVFAKVLDNGSNDAIAAAIGWRSTAFPVGTPPTPLPNNTIAIEIQSLERITTYQYSDLPDGSPGQTLQKTITERQPIGVIDYQMTLATLADAYALKPSKRTSETYYRLSERDNWRLVGTDEQCYILAYPTDANSGYDALNQAQKLELVPNPSTDSNYDRISNKGDTKPFNPERMPPPYLIEDRPVSETLAIAPYAGSYQERQRAYQVDYPAGVENGDLEPVREQLRAIAAFRAGVLIGRHDGCQFELDFSDDVFDLEPGDRIDFVETGTAYGYQIDAFSVVGTQRRLIVGGKGIWLGQTEVVDDAVTNPLPSQGVTADPAVILPPYIPQPVARGGFLFGGFGGVTTYTPNTVNASGSGGILFGGTGEEYILPPTNVSGNGGILFGGSSSATLIGPFFGGFNFGGSGSATVVNPLEVSGSGGILFGGTGAATVINPINVSGSGGILFGGSGVADTGEEEDDEMQTVLQKDATWQHIWNVNSLIQQGLMWNSAASGDSGTGTFKIGYITLGSTLYLYVAGGGSTNGNLKVINFRRQSDDTTVLSVNMSTLLGINTDIMTPVTLNTSSASGERVYLECIDNDSNNSWGWFGLSSIIFAQ